MNILVVDDRDDIGGLLRLDMAGHFRHVRVKQVLDIPPAVDAIQRHLPEIVVLDTRLPSGSGLGLIQQIKRLLPVTTVIVFTGYADMRTENLAMELGADHFFYKADDYDKLLHT